MRRILRRIMHFGRSIDSTKEESDAAENEIVEEEVVDGESMAQN